MHAAVIKLNTLPNPVRPATKHDNLLAVGWRRFAFILIGGIQVGGIGGEFGGTGVDTLVCRTDLQGMAQRTHGGFVGTDQLCDAGIGEPLALEMTHTDGVQCRETAVRNIRLDSDQFLDLVKEPRVYKAQSEHFIDAQAGTESLGHLEQALRTRFLQFTLDA